MKIQKVLFSSSEEYLDFWEPISKLFYEKLGMECVLIYFGENKKPSEKYGTVYYQQYLNYPKLIQWLWSRIWFTKTEPETTWLLGDIDLFPLQRTRFIDRIKDIPDNFHVHLGHNKISDPALLWQLKGPKDQGADLTSHYHAAKGWVFDKNFELADSFEESCKFLYENKYGLGFFSKDWDTEDRRYHCCCEQLTTERLRAKLNKINFIGLYQNFFNGLHRVQHMNYNEELLKSGWYVDFHSVRPYEPNKELINKILDLAWENQ